jgi:hypothetical protein
MRFVVVQKPMQDTCTSVLSVTLFLLVAMTGLMAVTVLEQSGIVQPGIALSSVHDAGPKVPGANMQVGARDAYYECEVIRHLAALVDEYSSGEQLFHAGMLLRSDMFRDRYARHAGFISSGTEEDAMSGLYFALYTCTGAAVTTGSYI